MQKRILIIIGIIVLLAIIAGGAFLLMQKPKTPIANVQNSNTNIAEWKTYLNAKYGYELKYPDYIHVQEANYYAFGDDPQGSVGFLDNDNKYKNYFEIDIIGQDFTTQGKSIKSLTLEQMVKSIW